MVLAAAIITTLPTLGQTTCSTNRHQYAINNCFNTCNYGWFFSLGNSIENCYDVKGDGFRINANPNYEPMPTIRFTFNKEGEISCNKERAGRIGIMPPYITGAPPAELYPVSTGNFNESDVFLVSTCDANNLLLSTNNSASRIKFLTTSTPGTQLERMTILNNGNVGIGTSSPDYKLHVKNHIAVGTESTTDTLYNPFNAGKITILPSNNGSWYHINNRGPRGGSLNFSAGVNVGDQEIMSMHQYGAKVCIGGQFSWTPLVNPALDGKLTVSEDATSTTGGYGAYASPILFRVERRNNTSDNVYKLISAGNNFNETFVVKSNGKVEIGSGTGTAGRRIPVSPDADYLLSVDGKVVGREMIVTATSEWSDYVFNDDYNLPTLEDVELQILSKKHLADVPSAVEVEKSGINLGEMQAVLLKKIEELTLYMIKMNKENAALQAEVATLKSLISLTK